ncbi:hypothetical protein KSP40_PGU002733 [Platanthera guangdongensis]|uniref:Uncharacterized protein n=1 Tax=Platanthera guangdongensis TaxID=2320717 RepID=A0ABR2MIM9_9ASPA
MNISLKQPAKQIPGMENPHGNRCLDHAGDHLLARALQEQNHSLRHQAGEHPAEREFPAEGVRFRAGKADEQRTLPRHHHSLGNQRLFGSRVGQKPAQHHQGRRLQLWHGAARDHWWKDEPGCLSRGGNPQLQLSTGKHEGRGHDLASFDGVQHLILS